MGKLTTIWEQHKRIPLNNLQLWAAADSTDDVGTLYDISGNGRNLTVSTTQPVLQSAVIGEMPAVYFNGSKNPLAWSGDEFTAKHIFIVAAVEGATFDAARGLLTGASANPLLVGSNGTDKFADNSMADNFVYRKSDVGFANSNLKAPVSGAFKIIEIVIPDGIQMGSLQIGKDRANSGTGFKGWFAEIIVFAQRKGWHARHSIYKYLAEKYLLWRELSDGTLVYPFLNNFASPIKNRPYIIRSQPLPFGVYKERRKGLLLDQYEFGFSTRRQTEVLAARAFEQQVLGDKTFAMENNSLYPPRRVNIRMLGEGTDINPLTGNLFDYRFAAQQMNTTSVPIDVNFDEILDSEPPEVGAMLAASDITSSSITWNWEAATDNIGVTGYQIEIETV